MRIERTRYAGGLARVHGVLRSLEVPSAEDAQANGLTKVGFGSYAVLSLARAAVNTGQHYAGRRWASPRPRWPASRRRRRVQNLRL